MWSAAGECGGQTGQQVASTEPGSRVASYHAGIGLGSTGWLVASDGRGQQGVRLHESPPVNQASKTQGGQVRALPDTGAPDWGLHGRDLVWSSGHLALASLSCPSRGNLTPKAVGTWVWGAEGRAMEWCGDSTQDGKKMAPLREVQALESPRKRKLSSHWELKTPSFQKGPLSTLWTPGFWPQNLFTVNSN